MGQQPVPGPLLATVLYQEPLRWASLIVQSGKGSRVVLRVHHSNGLPLVAGQVSPGWELLQSVAEFGQHRPPSIGRFQRRGRIGCLRPSGDVPFETDFQSVPRQQSLHVETLPTQPGDLLGQVTHRLQPSHLRSVPDGTGQGRGVNRPDRPVRRSRPQNPQPSGTVRIISYQQIAHWTVANPLSPPSPHGFLAGVHSNSYFKIGKHGHARRTPSLWPWPRCSAGYQITQQLFGVQWIAPTWCTRNTLQRERDGGQ